MTRAKPAKPAPKARPPSARRQILEQIAESGTLSRLIINQISTTEAQALAGEGLIHLNADYATILRPGRKWLEENP